MDRRTLGARHTAYERPRLQLHGQPHVLQMLLSTLLRPSADEFDQSVHSKLIQKSSLFGAIQNDGVSIALVC